MKKKNETPEKKRKILCDELNASIREYNNLLLYGGQDPFYPDGVNLNLVRNHIFYHRNALLKLCKEHNLQIPEECFLPVPEEVDIGYMANLAQSDRVKRLQQMGYKLTLKKPQQENNQLCFFT